MFGLVSSDRLLLISWLLTDVCSPSSCCQTNRHTAVNNAHSHETHLQHIKTQDCIKCTAEPLLKTWQAFKQIEAKLQMEINFKYTEKITDWNLLHYE